MVLPGKKKGDVSLLLLFLLLKLPAEVVVTGFASGFPACDCHRHSDLHPDVVGGSLVC